jgi:hypothetical protein
LCSDAILLAFDDPQLVDEDEFRVLEVVDADADVVGVVVANDDRTSRSDGGRNFDRDPSSDFIGSDIFLGGRSSLQQKTNKL